MRHGVRVARGVAERYGSVDAGGRAIDEDEWAGEFAERAEAGIGDVERRHDQAVDLVRLGQADQRLGRPVRLVDVIDDD